MRLNWIAFQSRLAHVWHLKNLNFQTTYHIQQYLASQHLARKSSPVSPAGKAAGMAGANTVLLVEHPPVYTVGIRTSGYPAAEELRLRALGAEFHRTNRGGLITFHGPGQLVVYPILDLNDFTRSMKWYICKLEETVIRMCRASFGVQAERSQDTGVWVGKNKICAMGVHGSRYITTHGLALNCDVDLTWFKHIVPCGIAEKGVTSLTEVLGRRVSVGDAMDPLLKSFSSQFDCRLEPLPLSMKLSCILSLEKRNCLDAKVSKQIMDESS